MEFLKGEAVGVQKLCTLRETKIFSQSGHMKKKLHGLSPRSNYTDRATAACRLNDCQLLRIEGAPWSA
jgi:hypothetical protein